MVTFTLFGAIAFYTVLWSFPSMAFDHGLLALKHVVVVKVRLTFKCIVQNTSLTEALYKRQNRTVHCCHEKVRRGHDGSDIFYGES